MFGINEIRNKIWLYNATVFNLLVAFMFLAYASGFWNIRLGPYMTMVFFFEISIVLISGPFLVAQWKDARAKLHSKEARHNIDLIYWGLLAMNMFAIGIHAGANQIALVQNSEAIELYDEHLGHYIGVVSLTLAFLATLWIYIKHPVREMLADKEFTYLFCSAFFQVLFIVPAIIEARSAIFLIIAASILILVCIFAVPFKRLYYYPMVIYYLMLATLSIIGLVLWYFIAGGFVQPSDIWMF